MFKLSFVCGLYKYVGQLHLKINVSCIYCCFSIDTHTTRVNIFLVLTRHLPLDLSEFILLTVEPFYVSNLLQVARMSPITHDYPICIRLMYKWAQLENASLLSTCFTQLLDGIYRYRKLGDSRLEM
jgi:hypothetical protein